MMIFIAIFALLIQPTPAPPSSNCLVCIGKAETGDTKTIYDDRRCTDCHAEDGTGVIECGMYNIGNAYWVNSTSPGTDHYTCTTDSAQGICGSSLSGRTCSEESVSLYTERYGTFCTGGPQPTCEDYAGIHSGGSKGCNAVETSAFRQAVQDCCNRMFGGVC